MDGLQFEDFELEGGAPSQDGERDPSIDFSIKVINALDDKASLYNKAHPLDKVSLSQLKQIYIDAASNHSTDRDEDINTWTLARVNMFLRIKSDKKITFGTVEKQKNEITKLELEDDQEYVIYGEIDTTKDWIPLEEDFEASKKDVEKYELNFAFSSIDELYIENQEGPISIIFH